MEHYKNLSLVDIEGEIWKSVVGYEGLYEVSNKGRVKSLSKPIFGTGESSRGIAPTKIHKQEVGKRRGKEYCRLKLHKNYKETRFSVHRLVAIHFIPNPENKPQVNHKDLNKSNNNDWNLEWATSSENIRHSVKAGSHKPILNLPKSSVGILHGGARFSEEEIYIIRNRYDLGEKPMSIWKDYQRVGYSGIVSICVRKTWKHLVEKL